MLPRDTEQPENLLKKADEVEDLDSKLNDIGQQIRVLEGELVRLEQLRQELKRQRALQASAPSPLPTKMLLTKPFTIRLSLLGCAVLLAGLGQYALRNSLQIGGWTVNGWLLYALAAVFFLLVSHHIKVVNFAQGNIAHTLSVSFHSSRFFWPLLILAIITMLGGMLLFNVPAVMGIAWNLHIASILLFIAAFIRLEKPLHTLFRPRAQILTRFLRLLPILAVLALAAYARVWQLSEFPFGTWFDEAENGLAAAQILQDSHYRPLYLQATAMPAHFNYLVSFLFSFMGINILPLRLVAAGFGIATVLFAYLLLRRWFGEVPGIVAACILAVMRYHLTFSRFGMQGVTTPAFELAALYFLDRALSQKKASDFAWFGLMVGFGLTIHTAFRLLPVVLVIFLLGLFIAAFVKYGVVESIQRYVRVLLPQWLMMALALLIAVGPVAQFALLNQEAFFGRTKAVSIFQKRDEKDLGKALWKTTVKHLEMFNARGDNNGRHNLPGRPMLDPVMGVLFVLGVAYAMWHWRNPANSLMLLLFTIMLQAGIFSLDFEAPQSYRAIGIIPALVYFITLPIAVAMQLLLHAIWPKELVQAFQIPELRLSSGILGLAFIPLFGVITYLNFNTFFVTQRNDPSAWAQYSTAETIAANEINRLAANNDLFVSAAYYNHPTLRFIAGNNPNVQRWTVIDRLPIVHEANGRGIAMMFDGGLISTYNDARRLYPNGQYIEHRAPAGGGTVMYEVILTPDDLRSANGMIARYLTGSTAENQAGQEEILTGAGVDWTESQPMTEPFIADLQSTLYISNYGQYRFSIHGGLDSTLWIDELMIGHEPITLARGNHALRMQVPSSDRKAELWWHPPGVAQEEPLPVAHLFRPPVTNNGLLGAYYPSPDWSGSPAFMQVDPQVAFYFHIIPLPRPYSVEWTGKLFAPTQGDYHFALNSVDGSQLILDDRLVVDNPNGRAMVENIKSLTEGWHDITIRFSDQTSATQIYFYWIPPGASQLELVPTRYLLPPMGKYPSPSDTDH